MSQRFTGWLVVFAILASGVSCTRMGEPGAGEQTLATQDLKQMDSIPIAWGKLTSVSSVMGAENWVQLWFQDDEGIIRMVPYNVTDNLLSSQARIIPRD